MLSSSWKCCRGAKMVIVASNGTREQLQVSFGTVVLSPCVEIMQPNGPPQICTYYWAGAESRWDVCRVFQVRWEFRIWQHSLPLSLPLLHFSHFSPHHPPLRNASRLPQPTTPPQCWPPRNWSLLASTSSLAMSQVCLMVHLWHSAWVLGQSPKC